MSTCLPGALLGGTCMLAGGQARPLSQQDCALGAPAWAAWAVGEALGALGPHPHLPALWFQCLEAVAACTSSTWAAVRGCLAGVGRPPGAPCACPCRLWAVSSWPWSVEPSTCPTGEWWALRRALARWPLGSLPNARQACLVHVWPLSSSILGSFIA